MKATNTKLEIQYLLLSELVDKFLDGNAKKHDIGKIVDSIQRYGFRDPLAIDATLNKGSGAVVEGNGRLEALLRLQEQGANPPRFVVVVNGDWAIPCIIGGDSKTESEGKAYSIDHNLVGMFGSEFTALDMSKLFDERPYLEMLEGLAKAGDLPVSVDGDDLDLLLQQISNEFSLESNELTDPDEIPDADEVESIVKQGDIWQLGRHRLMCGDSTLASNVKQLMNNQKAVLLHADPPYGMGKEKDGVANDNLYREKLDEFQMKWWSAFRPYIEDNGSAYIWGNAEDLWRLWYCGGLKDSERLTFRSQIIWNKPPSAGPCGSPIGSDKMRSYPHGYEVTIFFMLGEQGFNNNADNYWEGWEPIRLHLEGERRKSGLTTAQCNQICGKQNMTQSAFTKGGFRLILEEDYIALHDATKGKFFKREYGDLKREYDDLKREYDDLKREWYATRAYFDNTHDNMTDVWEYPRVQGEERCGHATPKPVDMMTRILKSSSPIDSLVIEPFLGSGSTLIACERVGRICYGMELSENYCDVIIKRWEDFTGQTAVKVS